MFNTIRDKGNNTATLAQGDTLLVFDLDLPVTATNAKHVAACSISNSSFLRPTHAFHAASSITS